MANITSVTTGFFPETQEGFTTTTSGSVASGATTVGLNSVAGYTNGAYVTLVIEPTDVTKKQVFHGQVDTSGTQITNVKWTEGTNQTHNAGVSVVDYETATAWNAQRKGFLVNHNEDGTQKPFTESNIIPTAAIQDDAISTAKVANDAITPAKRSGGLKTGVIASTTFSTTGNKPITGLGFKPRMVRFTILPSTSSTSMVYGSGVADESGNTSWVFTSSTTSAFARESGNTGSVVIVIRTSGTTTPLVTANYVSMDADGFTINVTTAANVYPVAWEAYA